MGESSEATGTARRLFEFPETIRETCKYCAPLFFINSLTVVGLADLPKADAFNGTVTFIRFEGETYAVTAHHVVELLRKKAKEAHGDGWLFSTLLGRSGRSRIDQYLPSVFDTFRQPSAIYPEKAPDIALSRIAARYLEEIGKAAFPFECDADNKERIAIAVGYPMDEKFDVLDQRGRRVGMKCVHAVAERVSSVRFYSELQELPAIIGLRGVSGGPVFLGYEEKIILGGIAIAAPDFEFDPTSSQAYDPAGGLSDGPRVSFAIQPITSDLLRAWVAELS